MLHYTYTRKLELWHWPMATHSISVDMIPCIFSTFGHCPRHGLGDHTEQDTLQKSVGTKTGEGRCLTVGMTDMALTIGDRQLPILFFY